MPLDAKRLQEEGEPIANRLGISLHSIEARAASEPELAFARIAQAKSGAVIVAQNNVFFDARRRIAELALANKLPTMAPADLFVDEGAMLSYGPNWPAIFHSAASYVDRILKGARPSDLPVQQPTKFEFLINMKTAGALGIDLPPGLVGRADKVIE